GVYRYGLSVCRSTEDAEDAVQEALWAATRTLKSFRGTISSIVSWMFRIVRRECYRLLERRRMLPLGMERAVADGTADACELVSQRDRGAMLSKALGALEPSERGFSCFVTWRSSAGRRRRCAWASRYRR